MPSHKSQFRSELHKFSKNFIRRTGWLFNNLTLKRALNFFLACGHFLLRSRVLRSLPVIVKIDISPICNIQCVVCVHAKPGEDEKLKDQVFKSDQKMKVEQFRHIIDELKEETCAVSLYHLGDPFIHPDLDEMCLIAKEAGLNVHISSNFSFKFSDERIASIVNSGTTHLTVCVDGLSQEKYERTRVGGKIDLVLSNLASICNYKREHSLTYPIIEVQYLKFQHNVDELEEAYEIFESLGVDKVTDFWGHLHTYVDLDPERTTVYGPMKNKLLARCFWPYFSMLIKYDGEVLPCCMHRMGDAYAKSQNLPIMGNVFQTPIRELWNSHAYQQSRRMVTNPQSINSDLELKDNFCNDGRVIFDTNVNEILKEGHQYTVEESFSKSN